MRTGPVAFLLVLTLCACGQRTGMVPGDSRSLDAGWTLSGHVKGIDANVPSTVAGVLYDCGFYGDDLLEGRNYEGADRGIFDSIWTYKTAFDGKPPKGMHSELVFDGLGYYADIFLNGRQLASSDTTFGVFIRRAYDVTDLLKNRNKLEVRLRRARPGDLNIGFVDWNPRPLDESMGIVRPVTLHTTGTVSIEDVLVVPDLDTETLASADLEVRVRLRNRGARPAEGFITLGLGEAGCFSFPFSLDTGEERKVILTPSEVPMLHVDNPRIWWTHDLGSPELYTLETGVEVDGAVSDTRETVFGIRKIESRLTEGDHRQFILNGRDILLKGAGWTDDIFLRDTPESISRQVYYVKDMNMNLIRFENIWGKDDTVYDLCDREGVLALVGFSCQWEWEDYCGLPEAGGYGCINTPESEELAVRYFHDQVVRLHNHPSVIAWLTGSDRIPNPGLEERYLAIFAEEDYRPYVCSASGLGSLAGWSGTKMEGPYEYVGPDYWYKDRNAGGAFGFNTETGIGANLPQLGSLRRMIPEDALWPLSDTWDYHCTASSSAMNSTRVLQETVNGLYGGFDGLEDFVMKAHAVDYDGTRAMFEAFRVRMPETTGIVQWMLNSAWPSLYWQLYDYYGVPTAGYYGVKKACEPVQLIFDYADRHVYLVDERPGQGTFTASVKIYDAASRLIVERTATVDASYRDVLPVFDLKSFDGKSRFVSLSLADTSGPVADNFYCLPAKDNVYDWEESGWYVTPIAEYADLGFVFAGKPAEVEMSVKADGGTVEVTLTNRSDVMSCMNVLQAVDARGDLVVPAFWSDNFFALTPGQTRTVTLRTDPGRSIKVVLNGSETLE